MTTNESEAWDGLPSAEELCRLTSRNARGDFANSPSHEAFIALGESADAAAKDFDWQRMAALLVQELEVEMPGHQAGILVTLPLRQRASKPKRAIVWISTCSAAMLLVGLAMSMLSLPEKLEVTGPIAQLEPSRTMGIDSWERTPSQGDLSGAWNDELDAELAATRRALKQGRDPWVNDEPVLSSVFAQVNELSAGLMFEPF